MNERTNRMTTSLLDLLIADKNLSIWTVKGPCRAFIWSRTPKICVAWSILGSMKVQEGPLVHIIVPGYSKSCYQSLKGPRNFKM